MYGDKEDFSLPLYAASTQAFDFSWLNFIRRL